MPATAMTSATTIAILPQRFSPGGAVWRSNSSGAGSCVPASGFLSGISLSRLGGRRRGAPCTARRIAAMDNAEHHRHEQQSSTGGEDQAADHGAAQRGVLLAAFA